MSRKDIPLLHEKAGEGSLNAGFIPWYDAGCAEFWAEANGCLSLFRSRGEVVCGFARGIFWDGIADAVSGACVMVYSWAWKYFLLASILDVKPKAMLFVVYKIPGYKTVMLWEFFPRILPRAIFPMHGICLVHSSPGQNSGFISNLLNIYVGLCKEIVWKQVPHAKCPVSHRRAARLAVLAGMFYNQRAVNQEKSWTLTVWVIFSVSSFELPANVLFRFAS